MNTLSTRIQDASALLAPYAVPIEGMLGRKIAEPDDDTRFAFQRDRDRIIHTQAFRRLKGKTQVFVEGKGDHYRTRLTHTMEVAQISRDIARTLGLNEDLAECIALAHDLGHPPFGHSGEQALDLWMREHGGHFEHNEQSERIVTLIEEHGTVHHGLNLNREILEGLRKHTTTFDHPIGTLPHAPTLEAQIVNLADEIAYTGHDCDDGLAADLFTLKEISTVQLAADAQVRAGARGTSLRGSLIHLLVSDLYAETERQIAGHSIKNLQDVYAAREELVGFSHTIEESLNVLRAFLWQHMYLHPRVVDAAKQGQTIITDLCTSLLSHPTNKILEFQERTASTLPESVKDYVAGMTDRFARLSWEKFMK